ncbi:hypothetical protein [Flavobacterium psychrotolerans]|uniref:HEPN domain-containing protein n=1 Tax=Flavobacterium psychrotolerans TaxID=2169410 RepID=A0A2U1JQM9_9FLAO|nr:hypothetical protein [Flavobacterium psychrotolerans]PWA07259.1 hypothetical protein DB895_00610 [Flavobacterium psychrotolerans]
MDKDTSELFTMLRFENYVTARYIAFTCGSFNRMAHYLMGMSLELSYKFICMELKKKGIQFSNNEDKLLKNSHDLIKLHELCKSKGRLLKIINYESFLFYANAFYKTRYPEHIKESTKIASEKFKQISFSAHNIFPFDDLISQIDSDIFDLTNDEKTSIIYVGIFNMNTHPSNSLFHSNGKCYDLIPKYEIFLNSNIPNHVNSMYILKNKRESILRSKEVYMYDSYEKSKSFDMKKFISHLGEK